MDTDSERLVNFVNERIKDDLAVANQAHVGFQVEATAHVTSLDHAAFLRRFNPEWVVADCARKAVLVAYEVSPSDRLRQITPETYAFNVVRFLATA